MPALESLTFGISSDGRDWKASGGLDRDLGSVTATAAAAITTAAVVTAMAAVIVTPGAAAGICVPMVAPAVLTGPGSARAECSDDE